jgi:magnesium chelatase family protein
VSAPGDVPDLADVRGHAVARLGLEAAAIGGHHLSLVGPPGVGKSMLGLRLATALPDLEDEAALEVTSLLSITGQLDPRSGIVRRPVTQAPHHAISAAAFLGSAAGSRIRLGALTAAHHGVLLMDEAPEFNRQCLEGLRQPLESGVIPVARVGAAVRLPAAFQLIVAANPCPCGLHAGRGDACTCTGVARRRYAERLSGPLMDRIDIRLRVSRPSAADLAEPGESSAAVRARVCEARDRAATRFAGESWRSGRGSACAVVTGCCAWHGRSPTCTHVIAQVSMTWAWRWPCGTRRDDRA